MFDTKTPSAAQMVEDARMKTRLAELGRRQQETAERLNDQHLTDAQIEAEQFQFESNALAEKLPLYAAARSASANFLVVPLDGTEPLIKPTDATNDPWELFSHWARWPEANPGILLGRVGGVLALKVDDMNAYVRLRELTRVHNPGVEDGRDSVAPFVEHRELPRYTVHLVKPSRPVSMRLIQGWGPDYTRAIREVDQEERQRQLETFFLVFSYHTVTSGLDAWDFKSRTVLPGVKLMGEGEVLAWQGSILDGGIQVVAPSSKPPEVPLWLASSIGRPRSRKVMAAAREAYEAIQRRDTAHVTAAIAARRAYEEQEREQAIKDREKAEAILAEVMDKG